MIISPISSSVNLWHALIAALRIIGATGPEIIARSGSSTDSSLISPKAQTYFLRSGSGTFFEAILFEGSLFASGSDWRTRNSKEAVPVSLIAVINESGRFGRDPPSKAFSNPSMSAFLCESVFALLSSFAQVKKFCSPPLKANRRMSLGRISL